MRILLVDDDEQLVRVLKAILVKQNYLVDVALDGEMGWDLINTFSYELVLLDVMLPKLDGITLCRRLRQQEHNELVMLLTSRNQVMDKLQGLDSGADDYIVKPFNTDELLARIRALTRRGIANVTSMLSCGPLCLNLSTREITYNGNLLNFSRKEYLLLELFLRHPRQVFSRSEIVDRLWVLDDDPPYEDTVKSHIKTIRRKLKKVGADDLIETLYGQGYRIQPSYIVNSYSSSSSSISSQEQTLNSVATTIWERTKGVSLKRITYLEEVVSALREGIVDEEIRHKAIQTAHKLAGSLGTFNFPIGSKLALELEVLFQNQSITQDLLNHAIELVRSLRLQLEGEESTVNSNVS
jgi:DNA-binding response OmpR family regulator/HPt (histidine-containing phosphotransfer) domain-containing protein